MAAGFQEKARRLRNAVEPVAAGVYFAPEAHQAYEALGFEGSPVSQDGVARPELKSYFTSRGACLGQVPGEVVAAAFGVFNPKAVVPAVTAGWQITGRGAVLAARERGATQMLQRVLGDDRWTSCWTTSTPGPRRSSRPAPTPSGSPGSTAPAAARTSAPG